MGYRGFRICFWASIFITGLSFIARGQCTNGTEPECQCSTAEVLCTVDDLDGYQFSMDPFLHPQDAPDPLCPGLFCNCIPHNPTWFAFVAWCEDLDLRVEFANCTAVNGTIGAQIAIYSDCTNFTPVDCNVSSADCDNTNDKTLNLRDLEIGQVYYFLIDGCSGSYCDITIDVVGTCGAEEIEDWTNSVSGETNVCVGETFNYSVDDLDGANLYHWYLDGVEIGTSDEPNFDINWPTEGTFELCVDASNDPCVPVTDPPSQICITVNVYDPDAGTIDASPTPLCPGETTDITVSGYNTNSGLELVIIITDQNNIVEQVTTGDFTSFSSDQCATYTAYAYQYIIAENPTLPTVGSSFSAPDCNTDCCDLINTTFTFEDTEAPTFVTTPADSTVACFDILPPLVDLDYTDNCIAAGMVSPVESGTADLCSGGVLQRTWTATDSCGNIAEHVQTITVNALPEATFLNIPPDSSIFCNELPSSYPDLEYSNNASDAACEITGIATPTVTENVQNCEGTIEVLWEATDLCGRLISHTQIITIVPPAEPSFINPPANTTLSCTDFSTFSPVDLDYDNNESGGCAINGTVSPTSSGMIDECGGDITYTWEYTDSCNRTITHQQIVTVEPAAQATFSSTPADITLNCSDLPLPTPPDLNYSNSSAGACLIEGVVSPTVTGSADECGGIVTYTWEFTDNCSRTITHIQTITVEPADEATFSNPPADMTLNCNALPLPTPPNLNYSNGASGICLIEGTQSPSTNGSVDECGGSLSYTWEFTDDCNRTISHTQNITVEPAPEASFVNPPGAINLTCDEFENLTIPDLSYDNGETGDCAINGSVSGTQNGTIGPCGGTVSIDWSFQDNCGRTITHSQTINVEPASIPDFINVPTDITVTCQQAVNIVPITLEYNNGESGACSLSEIVQGTNAPNFNACGGIITQSWSAVDDCGNPINAQRVITVEPAPAPSWVNPPGDITVNCEEVENIGEDLVYSNNAGSNNCLIENTVSSIFIGSYDECGGSLVQEWSAVDNCGNVLNHSRTITVNPAAAPQFIDPPADVTLACGLDFPDDFELSFTNSLNSPCEIAGSVLSTHTISGLTAVYTWSFTNPCDGTEITHEQSVTLTQAPDIILTPNTILVCAGTSFDLSQISVEDLNGNPIDITYHSANPPTTNNEIDPIYFPQGPGEVFIRAVSSNGCEDVASLIVEIEQPPSAGDDQTVEICENDIGVNLNTFRSGNFDPNGFWISPHSNQIDISDPTNVSFLNISPGSYLFNYVVPGDNVCAPDTATITIDVLALPTIEIISISCIAGNAFYEVIVELSPNSILRPNVGEVENLGNNQYRIFNIPINSNLDIFALLGTGVCPNIIPVNAPDCNCPNVPPPTAGPDTAICFGSINPTLSVTVEQDLFANWYDAPGGGNLLQANSTTYTPTVSDPGIYTFYVETYNLPDSCVSSTRTPITFEIKALPQGQEISLVECSSSSFASFELDASGNLITNNPNISISFFENENDARDSLNAINSPFTNTEADRQTIFVRLTGSSGCINVIPLNLIVAPLPQFDIEVIPETCANDSSGQISISNLSGNVPFNFTLNGNQQSDSVFNDLTSGTYTLEVRDTNNCFDTDTITLNQGQELELEIISLNCNNNGTVTDSTDDNYTLEFILNHANNSGTYRVQGPSINITGLTYGDQNNISLPANGQQIILEFIDESTGCSISYTTAPLNHCSTDCRVNIDFWEATCSDNGTPTDPSDDFYIIKIVSTGVNTGSSGQYIARIAGQSTVTSYGDTATFSLSANGNTETLTVTDQEITACFNSIEVGPLDPCSDDCAIIASIVEIVCDDNGTLDDNSDDLFTVRLVVTGQNTGNNGFEIGASLVGNYGDTITLGPYPISDGNQSILISDTDRSDCELPFTLPAPPPCSSPCTLNSDWAILACDNNGTGANENDDFVSIRLRVTVTEGSPSRFVIRNIDGEIIFGPYDYDIDHTIAPIPANGQEQILIIQDELSLQCVDTIRISEPSCSECDITYTLGPDVIFDCNTTNATLFVEASDALNIDWSGPSGFSDSGDSVEVSRAGNYIVSIEFADSCFVTDSIQATNANDLPVALVGPDGFINCESDSFLVQNNSDLSNPNLIAEWTDGSGNLLNQTGNFWTDTPGTYNLIVIDTVNQCTSSVETVVVTQNFNEPAAIILADPDSVFDCFTRSITLTAEDQNNAIYQWVGNEIQSDDRSITLLTSGEITLIVIDTLSLCRDSASIRLEDLDVYPFISIEEPDTINCSQTSVTLDGSNSFRGDSILLEWLNANQDPLLTDSAFIQVSQGGWYFLRSTDLSNGCQNIDSVFVVENLEFPSGTISGDLSLNCGQENGSLQLEPDASVTNIQWSTLDGTILSGQNTLQIEYEGPGTYRVSFMNPNSLCFDTLSVSVQRTDDISYESDKLDILCEGEKGLFIVNEVFGTPPYNISWNGTSIEIGESISNIDPGTYLLEISDGLGCTTTDTIVFQEGRLVSIDLLEFLRVQLGETTILEAFVNLDSNEIASINWTPPVGLTCTDCLITSVTATSDTEYTITVSDTSGCIGEASIRLIIEQPQLNIFIPNAMTPNGDNVNDFFTLYSDQNLIIDEFLIFDRWGNKLFEANNLMAGIEQEGWDGTFRGKPMGEGVYVYSFKVILPNGGIRYFKGDVTLSR